MPPGFRCRDYQPGDFPAIQDLWAATGLSWPQRGDSAAAVERTLVLGGRLLMLEEDTGRLAGTAWLTLDGRRTCLHHFAIRPDLQGRGLGRRFLDPVLEAARALGLQLKLEVHRDNTAAQALYRHAGFNPVEDIDVMIMRETQAVPNV